MTSTPKATESATITVQSSVELAKRAFALEKYEQAVEYYASALEIATKEHGDDAPEVADLYFSYGKALTENAISQSSVLGKEQPEAEPEPQASGSGSGATAPILSFAGDADDAVDLFAATEEEDEHDDEGEGEGEHDDEGPEDDFNAAWEVLDLARAIYAKQVESDDDCEVKLKLADTYIALGDVSLETEKFDQAISDFKSGLDLKLDLLPTLSRQIAEAHYKLSMVLDLTSGRLSDAIHHAVKALESVEARLIELQAGLAGQLPPLSDNVHSSKGKGKVSNHLIRDDYVQNMTKTQIENEIKELLGLKDDLALKVEELKTLPEKPADGSAPELAAKALDAVLNNNPGSSSSMTSVPVNDLTSVVKKKKKVIVPTVELSGHASPAKRKADIDTERLNAEKKQKLELQEP